VPTDASFKAIDALVPAQASLLELNVHSVTEGIDALGRVTVCIRDDAAHGARIFRGSGSDTDIIVASATAYLRALNRLLASRARTTEAVQEAAQAS
ncbi:MAG TPA: alpha-isopropylmalate synthase regulatory domain-containing protein, partial [Labilithrix sp.]|nr:alpha-isopropylmalate synthase regulatory domain-containing protein [Labilithrix sp.]